MLPFFLTIDHFSVTPGSASDAKTTLLNIFLQVSAFSTWEKELHKIVFDPRYLLVNSEERKQVTSQLEKVATIETEDCFTLRPGNLVITDRQVPAVLILLESLWSKPSSLWACEGHARCTEETSVCQESFLFNHSIMSLKETFIVKDKKVSLRNINHISYFKWLQLVCLKYQILKHLHNESDTEKVQRTIPT